MTHQQRDVNETSHASRTRLPESFGIWRGALLLVALCSTVACGKQSPGSGAATAGSHTPSTQCFTWNRDELHRNQGPDVERIDVVLRDTGRYEAAVRWDLHLEPTSETGTWRAEGGRVRFHPDDSANVEPYRATYSVAWKPGESLNWVIQARATTEPQDGPEPTWETVEVKFLIARVAECREVLERLERARGTIADSSTSGHGGPR